MEIITIGKKDETKKYDFRETCFGIYIKNNELLVTIDPKRNQYTFIGGGIEPNESHEETLKREFIEEVGIKIDKIKEFITIDCFWLASGDFPMESLAHFYKIETLEYIDNIETEGEYKFININDLDLPLPYQEKALEIIKETNLSS